MSFLSSSFREGYWSVWSVKDPRWDGHGRAELCGGFSMPKEAREHIDRVKKELGESEPDDLEYGYMKD